MTKSQACTPVSQVCFTLPAEHKLPLALQKKGGMMPGRGSRRAGRACLRSCGLCQPSVVSSLCRGVLRLDQLSVCCGRRCWRRG